MATPKQVDRLIILWTKTGHLRDKCAQSLDVSPGMVTPRELARFTALARELLLAASTMAVSDEIQRANAELGWDPQTSPASEIQRRYLRDLEIRLYGRRVTLVSTPMTYADADARIKNLKAEIAEQKSANRDRAHLRRVT